MKGLLLSVEQIIMRSELFCFLCNYCNTKWNNIKCGIRYNITGEIWQLILGLALSAQIQQTTNWWYFSYLSQKLGYVDLHKNPKTIPGENKKILENAVCWHVFPEC